MDSLQDDLWKLVIKYGISIEDIRFKVSQMMNEYEFNTKSGIHIIEYRDTITIIPATREKKDDNKMQRL